MNSRKHTDSVRFVVAFSFVGSLDLGMIFHGILLLNLTANRSWTSEELNCLLVQVHIKLKNLK